MALINCAIEGFKELNRIFGMEDDFLTIEVVDTSVFHGSIPNSEGDQEKVFSCHVSETDNVVSILFPNDIEVNTAYFCMDVLSSSLPPETNIRCTTNPTEFGELL
jgi:hypothetical protein